VKERFVKNFALGKGVESESEEEGKKSWFIDGKFGGESLSLTIDHLEAEMRRRREGGKEGLGRLAISDKFDDDR